MCAGVERIESGRERYNLTIDLWSTAMVHFVCVSTRIPIVKFEKAKIYEVAILRSIRGGNIFKPNLERKHDLKLWWSFPAFYLTFILSFFNLSSSYSE